MSRVEPIYLDFAATTPLSPAVVQTMQQLQQQALANPASLHTAGRQTRHIIEAARETILQKIDAQVQGMHADRLIFTSGGTEANHLAILGLVSEPKKTIAISSVEHSSLHGAAELWQQRGGSVDKLPVQHNGVICKTQFQEYVAQHTSLALVSVQLVNNETGVVQPIAELAAICRSHNVLFHCDAVQALGKIPLSFRDLQVDALTLAAHKIHGPVGIGALLLKPEVQFQPQMRGGFQQGGLRPGTESVVLAAGFAQAVSNAVDSLPTSSLHLQNLQSFWETNVKRVYPACVINGENASRAFHISNVAFPGVDRQALFLALDFAGIYCSTGSACASGSSEPSPVLLAMQSLREIVASSLRFSFSPSLQEPNLSNALNRLETVLHKLSSRR
jgi:cysteine desulfurase